MPWFLGDRCGQGLAQGARDVRGEALHQGRNLRWRKACRISYHGRMNRLAAIVCGAALAVGLSVGGARAEGFPEKPLRFVVGFTPAVRATSSRAARPEVVEGWSQQVVIENRPGAGGNIAAELVAKSAPDGTTWLLGNNSHPRHQPEPVTRSSPTIRCATSRRSRWWRSSRTSWLVIRRARDLGEGAESRSPSRSRASSTTLSSGAGAAAHLAAELFKTMAGVDMLHVPYKRRPAGVDGRDRRAGAS